MFDFVGLATSALDVVKGWIGLQDKKLDLRNAQDVKDAAIRQDEQSARDKTAKAIAEGDVNELRKEIAE